jgi:hypothetical protein
MTQHFQPGVLDLSREAIQQSYGVPEIPLEIPPPVFYDSLPGKPTIKIVG